MIVLRGLRKPELNGFVAECGPPHQDPRNVTLRVVTLLHGNCMLVEPKNLQFLDDKPLECGDLVVVCGLPFRRTEWTKSKLNGQVGSLVEQINDRWAVHMEQGL